MIRRLAFAILRRYPPAWRERYEAEVSALIDQTGVRFGDLAELLRGLLTERAAALMLDDERPRRTLLFFGLLKLTFTLGLIATASLIGYALRTLTGPWSEAMQIAGGFAVVVFAIVFLVVLIRARFPWSAVGPPYSPRVGLIMLLAFFIAVVFGQWGDLLGSQPSSLRGLRGPVDWLALTRWFVWSSITADLASSLWPAQRMLNAFGAISGAEAQIRSNRQWVDGCHTMIALGVPSPLAEAEAQVAHWTRERDKAREQLHALGYRARFGA